MRTGRTQRTVEVTERLFLAAEDYETIAPQRDVANVRARVLMGNGTRDRLGNEFQCGRSVAFPEGDNT